VDIPRVDVKVTTTETTAENVDKAISCLESKGVILSREAASRSLLGVLIASIILLWATAAGSISASYPAWRLPYTYAVAGVSLGMSVVFLVLYVFNFSCCPEDALRKPLPGPFKSARYELVGAAFLTLWWFFGACIITFGGTFTVVSNGYFAAWGGFAASVAWLNVCSVLPEQFSVAATEVTKKGSLIGMLFASLALLVAIVERGQGSSWTSDSTTIKLQDYSSTMVYGLVVCCLSMVFALVLLLVERANPLEGALTFLVSLTMVVLWGSAAIALTFYNPFTIPGNGYFAVWLGLGAASNFCISKRRGLGQQQSPPAEPAEASEPASALAI